MKARIVLEELHRITSFLLCVLLFGTVSVLHLQAAELAPEQSPEGPEWLIKTWESEGVLPDTSVTSIAQTPDGYLWLGTFTGLVRFDGMKFNVFNPKTTPELPNDGIVNLHVDRNGRLWVSTLNGIVTLDNGKWRQMRLHTAGSEDFARTISERANGDILVTTFNGKILEFSNEHFTELPAPPGEPRKGYFGCVDEEDRWWVAQNRFIGRWESNRWVAMMPPPELSAEEVGCARARDGGIWVLFGTELRKLRHGKESTRLTLREHPGGVWSLFEDSGGAVWIASEGGGFYRIAPDGSTKRWRTINGHPYNGRLVFEDRERNLWLGGSGLMRFQTASLPHVR